MKIISKHIVIFLMSVLLVACAMESNKVKNSEMISDIEADDMPVEAIETIDNFEFITESSIDQTLINEKLQDFYDLLALQNEHPEFTNEVIKQLKNYSTDSISDFNSETSVIIKNIRSVGNPEIINDSLKKLKLVYDKISDNKKTTDSIFALIAMKTITLDGEAFLSQKVRFSKD